MMNKIMKTNRPWGYFETLTKNKKCTVKIIYIKKGGVLSRQYHNLRDELWIALDKGLTAEIGNKKFRLKPYESVRIPKKVVHRLSAETNPGRVLEISFGNFKETDIVRLEDKYGRV